MAWNDCRIGGTFPLVSSWHQIDRSCWDRTRPRVPAANSRPWWLTGAGEDACGPSTGKLLSLEGATKGYVPFNIFLYRILIVRWIEEAQRSAAGGSERVDTVETQRNFVCSSDCDPTKSCHAAKE